VTVEHDDRGVAVRIVDHQFGPLVIWDRAAEPWERCGERGLGALRDEAVRGIAEAVPSDAFAVFRLVLDYTGGMGVAPWVRVGPAADRPAWDAPRPAGSAWWSALRVGRPLLVDPAFDEDLCWRLERAAAFHQPDDPARFVLDGLAALLARHDWSGVLRPTDDFVVYTAMHDQGWDEQLASLRAVNPPERVGLWERRWLGS
jgi:hypothetical protein